MSTSRHTALDPSNATPRWVPKLVVRNRSLDGTALAETSNASNTETRLSHASPVEMPSSAGDRKSSDPVLKTQQYHRRRDSGSGSSGHHTSKRKSSGVLGFLTLKEPSTSALEEFAEHEKKKAAQKGVKQNPMGMTGVSSQKLPGHVPKVNSKWDGLPESVKRSGEFRSSENTDGGSKRGSIISLGAMGNGEAPRRRYGSLSSRPYSHLPQDKKRIAVRVTEIERNDKAAKHPLPAPATPLLAPVPGKSLCNPTPTFLHPPSPPPPEIELPGLDNWTATSPESSPRTPAIDHVLPVLKRDARVQSPLELDGLGTLWINSDAEEVVVKTAGPDVLAPPMSTPRKDSNRLLSTPSTIRRSAVSPIPTQMPSSTVRNFSYPSPHTLIAPDSQQAPEKLNTTSRARQLEFMSVGVSPANSTYSVASNMSGQWRSPPNERFSLGPRLSRHEVLPWEQYEPSTTPAISSSGTLKRLSYKLSRK